MSHSLDKRKCLPDPFKLRADLGDFLCQFGLSFPIVSPISGNKLFNHPLQRPGAHLVGWDLQYLSHGFCLRCGGCPTPGGAYRPESDAPADGRCCMQLDVRT
jgi:hypothetical protein